MGGCSRSAPQDALEEDVDGRGEVAQLDGGAERARSEAQHVALLAGPAAELDDHDEAAREQPLREVPLQRLDVRAPRRPRG